MYRDAHKPAFLADKLHGLKGAFKADNQVTAMHPVCACLQVSSEDNVLCTAQAYADAQHVHMIAAAEAHLARLIRVPNLSKLWQSTSVLSEGVFFSNHMLSHVAPQLRQYMALTWVGPCTTEEAKKVMTQPQCSSWFLGDRQHTPLADGVQLTWELPVSELKATSMRAYTGKQVVGLESGPSASTPPLQGIRWGLLLQCVCTGAQSAGSNLGVYCKPVNLPKGTYPTCSYQYTISSLAHTANGVWRRLSTGSLGRHDFFGLGVMAGGWDESAWAAKGLPTSGTLQLKLKVKLSS
jgi:hypothetical protein